MPRRTIGSSSSRARGPAKPPRPASEGRPRNFHEISSLVLAGLPEADFFARLTGSVSVWMGASSSAFFLRREGGDDFFPVPAAPGASAPLRPAEVEIFRRDMEAGLSVPLTSREQVRLFFPKESTPRGRLCPLVVEGGVAGLLAVAGPGTGAWSEDDARALSLLAGHATQYLHNRFLIREKEHRLRDLAMLQEVYSLLTEEPDLEKTLRHVVAKVGEGLGADVCAFLLYDEGTHELVTQPGAWGLPEGTEPMLYRVRVDDAVTSSGRVFETREPFLSGDAWNDSRVNPRYAKLWNYRALLVAPLVVGERCIGVLRVGHRRPGVFTRDHLRLAVLVAEHAAVVIENARLYRKSQGSVRELKRLNELKTEFLSMVSHDLLSPLSSVEGFLALMIRGDAGPLEAKQKNFLALCSKSLQRVTMLIDDLLDISRIEAGTVRIRLESVDIGELLEAAVHDRGPTAQEKGLALRVDLPAGLPRVTADPHRIRQVVDNLLTNALKFTPTQGKISVSAHREEKEIVVSVKDTGIGLSREEKEKIFERYYQVDNPALPRARGAGLGLAICKSLVEHHGGRIWVDSSPGQGSDFQFSLPLPA